MIFFPAMPPLNQVLSRLTVIGIEALLVLSAEEAAVAVTVQAALSAEKVGAVNTTEVPLLADRLPQPDAGLRLHLAPELDASLRTEAVRPTVVLVAMACAVSGDMLTLIGTTVISSEADLVLSAFAVTDTVTVHGVVISGDLGAP